MNPVPLQRDDPACPVALARALDAGGHDRLLSLGNLEILREPLTGIFCSVCCPGQAILASYDLARDLRGRGAATVGGFQTPIERDMLDLLLRGRQPVVICPARGIAGMRVPAAWRGPIEDGRLLVLSPFAAGQRRPTSDLARARNTFVAALAAMLLVVYAEPGGATEALCLEALTRGVPVRALDLPVNAHLVARGASVWAP